MRRGIPPRPGGSDREATFMQWVHDSIREGRINDSETVKVTRDPRGIYLRAISKGGGGPTGSVLVAFMTITQISPAPPGALLDYVYMSGGGQTDQIKVAKPEICKPSIIQANWDGVIVDYAYTDDNHRTSTVQGQAPPNSQLEVLYPRIKVGAKYPAMFFPDGTNVPGVSWAFISEGFKWQRLSNQ